MEFESHWKRLFGIRNAVRFPNFNSFFSVGPAHCSLKYTLLLKSNESSDARGEGGGWGGATQLAFGYRFGYRWAVEGYKPWPCLRHKLAIAMKQIQVIVIALLHLEYKQISSINPCRQYPVL